MIVPYFVLTVLFGELLLLSLELVVLVLVLLPAPIERPLHVALRAAEVRLEEPVHGKEDDAVQVLHLQDEEEWKEMSELRSCQGRARGVAKLFANSPNRKLSTSGTSMLKFITSGIVFEFHV